MIRTGVGVVVLSALIYLLGAILMEAPPPEAGANIGAGILALLIFALLIVGAVLIVIGIVRRLYLRRKRSTMPR